MIWIVAVLSAVVDNVPITIALIPVIRGLGASGIDVDPLWWALAFGAGFGGSVWALVDERRAEEFLAAWQSGYRRAFRAHAPDFFATGAGPGLMRL